MGAGVQTTAIAIKYGKLYDFVIFSDTRNEDPATYEYIEKYLKPHFKEIGTEWVTVGKSDGSSVLDGAARYKWASFYFSKRECTNRYKVKPLNEYILKRCKPTPENKVIKDIGFSIDEARRLNTARFEEPWETMNFPLINDHISRQGCYDIIKDFGWPAPPKSGCVFCPVAGRKVVMNCKKNFPKEFERLMYIEEHSRGYPRVHIMRSNKPLRNIADQSFLDDYAEDGTCDSGSCFT